MTNLIILSVVSTFLPFLFIHYLIIYHILPKLCWEFSSPWAGYIIVYTLEIVIGVRSLEHSKEINMEVSLKCHCLYSVSHQLE